MTTPTWMPDCLMCCCSALACRNNTSKASSRRKALLMLLVYVQASAAMHTSIASTLAEWQKQQKLVACACCWSFLQVATSQLTGQFKQLHTSCLRHIHTRSSLHTSCLLLSAECCGNRRGCWHTL
jgi:hypothetical protein